MKSAEDYFEIYTGGNHNVATWTPKAIIEFGKEYAAASQPEGAREYQRCPICNGEGKVPTPLSTTTHTICDVCNGAKIIPKYQLAPLNEGKGIEEKSVNYGTFAMDKLFADGKYKEYLDTQVRKVKWLYNNSNKLTDVICQKQVWAIVCKMQQRIDELASSLPAQSSQAPDLDALFDKYADVTINDDLPDYKTMSKEKFKQLIQNHYGATI